MIDQYLADRRRLVDAILDANLPPANTPPKVIHEAMRYAVLGGGKRVRPILAIAAAEACGADIEPLLPHFAALELIHTYSLVHDDLRRGRKTTHIVFGEAMGILTGDALLTEAFAWLSRPPGTLDAIRVVAEAVDSKGMIGGQVADLEASGAPPSSAASLDNLEFIHKNKTGKLLTASVVLGGILGKASTAQMDALRKYGQAVGLAFQIVDDLLDQEQTSAELGKTAGKDLAQGKLTYPAVMGAPAARERVTALLAEAVENAARIGGPDRTGRVNYLADIARYICERRS